jgi:uncharacterized protein
MSAEERTAVLAKVGTVAGDGRYELFKTSKTFDSSYHRKQHGFSLAAS